MLSGIRVSVKFHIIYLTPRTTNFKQIHTNHQFWNENVKKYKLFFPFQYRILKKSCEDMTSLVYSYPYFKNPDHSTIEFTKKLLLYRLY